MNHAYIVQHESDRPYSNRNYVLGLVDVRHFDALNPGNQVWALNGYSLDALDEIPAGCMRPFARSPAQHYISRGVSLVEQMDRIALAEKLIDEILGRRKT